LFYILNQLNVLTLPICGFCLIFRNLSSSFDVSNWLQILFKFPRIHS
jgi:hypothetical protein